ncbi:hypothetical protein JST97_38490 [bacterium]|nr:hypothetical protein [bacterium]
MKTYSFTQRWSPALVAHEGRTVRPHLVAVVDEGEGVCPGVEMVENALRPAALARWLAAKIGKDQSGTLWVDDAALVGPLSMYFPKLKVSWKADPPKLNEFMQGFSAQVSSMKGEFECSLVALVGPEQALAFYTAAREFYAARPWERIQNEEVLPFRDLTQAHWDVIVLGSGGEEFGFYVVDQYGSPPTLGVMLHEPAYLAAADLDLIDRSGLVYPASEYPWVMTQFLAEPLSQAWVVELTWLLNSLSRLGDGAVEGEGRRLARAGQAGLVLIEALLVYWGKRSAVAQELAGFLVDFLKDWLEVKPRGQRNYERTFQELHWIGEDYLANVKKRKLWLDYFLGEPRFSGPSLSDKDRQAYLKTWKLVSQYARKRVNNS